MQFKCTTTYQSWLNHNISRTIINQAKSEGKVIAIEDLTGIRDRTNQEPRSKTDRRRSNSWAFYQLRIFLEYKAIQSGLKLVKVNPAYTSFMCHQCNHIHPVSGKSYRSGKSFKCGHWGCPGDSDLNGAMNISVLGGAVNPLAGSALFCSIADLIGITESPPILCVG